MCRTLSCPQTRPLPRPTERCHQTEWGVHEEQPGQRGPPGAAQPQRIPPDPRVSAVSPQPPWSCGCCPRSAPSLGGAGAVRGARPAVPGAGHGLVDARPVRAQSASRGAAGAGVAASAGAVRAGDALGALTERQACAAAPQRTGPLGGRAPAPEGKAGGCPGASPGGRPTRSASPGSGSRQGVEAETGTFTFLASEPRDKCVCRPACTVCGSAPPRLFPVLQVHPAGL